MSISVFDEAHRAEGKDCFGRVSVELWLRSMEGDVRSCSWMLSGRAREVDTVGAIPLEVEDQMGRQEEWEGF